MGFNRLASPAHSLVCPIVHPKMNYTFNNSRQAIWSFFKPAFDFASM